MIHFPINTLGKLGCVLFTISLCIFYSHGDVLQNELIIKLWEQFKSDHNKTYQNKVEEKLKLKNFHENVKRIDEHNELFKNGLKTHKLDINMFADMSPVEIQSQLVGGFKANAYSFRDTDNDILFSASAIPIPTLLNKLPDSMDWREYGAVGAVLNQQPICGSCWAFSGAAALEAHYFIKYGKMLTLSKQNLIDCSYAFKNNGCRGGMPHQAYEYIKRNGGIMSEELYPYEARDGICRYNFKDKIAYVRGYKLVEPYDEIALKFVVAKIGPVAVAINATDLEFYKSGNFHKDDCASELERLNHAVLVVGYGSDASGDYWLVKNSWGSHWGMQGYGKMARNRNNHCGIATYAVYPIL